MKIIKNASGKQTVKLSQQDWEDFGKKAGWLDENGKFVVTAEGPDMEREAQPAPAAPPRTKPGKTKPGKETKPGKKKPRNPVPVEKPGPKAKEKKVATEEITPDNLPTIASELKKKLNKAKSGTYFKKLAEHYLLRMAANYEDSASPGNLRFWQDIPDNSILSKNPILTQYGGELARANFEYVTDIAENKNIPVMPDMYQILTRLKGLLDQIQVEERGHEEALSELAKDVISKKWDVDRDELEVRRMDEMGEHGEPDLPEAEEIEMTPELEGEINKRILMNSIAQGAGLNELFDVPEMEDVREAVNAMNPRLIQMYEEFSNLMMQHFYYIDPEFVERMKDQLGDKGTGWSHNEYEEEGEDGEGGGVKTVAQGMNFIIICQELTKGLFSRATDHQLDNQSRADRGLEPLTREQAIAILKNSDELVNEQMQMQIGPENFRRFMESKPEDVDTRGLVGYMGAGPADELFVVSSDIISDPEEAKETLGRYTEDLMQSGFMIESEAEEAEDEEEAIDAIEELNEGPMDQDEEFEFDMSEEDRAELESLFGKPVKPDEPRDQGPRDQGDEFELVKFDDDDDEEIDMEKELASLFGPGGLDLDEDDDPPPPPPKDDDDDDKPYWMA